MFVPVEPRNQLDPEICLKDIHAQHDHWQSSIPDAKHFYFQVDKWPSKAVLTVLDNPSLPPPHRVKHGYEQVATRAVWKHRRLLSGET